MASLGHAVFCFEVNLNRIIACSRPGVLVLEYWDVLHIKCNARLEVFPLQCIAGYALKLCEVNCSRQRVLQFVSSRCIYKVGGSLECTLS